MCPTSCSASTCAFRPFMSLRLSPSNFWPCFRVLNEIMFIALERLLLLCLCVVNDCWWCALCACLFIFLIETHDFEWDAQLGDLGYIPSHVTSKTGKKHTDVLQRTVANSRYELWK